MNTLTLITEKGVNRYSLNGDKTNEAVVRLINGSAYTTEELIRLVVPGVVE